CIVDTPTGDWSAVTRAQVKRYVDAQLGVFEASGGVGAGAAGGYFFWSWKAPGAWGFLNGVEGGWIANPVQDYQRDVCNFIGR
ncbi:hypothetical protein LTS18_005152, partial [Coniosporium uncinatum]